MTTKPSVAARRATTLLELLVVLALLGVVTSVVVLLVPQRPPLSEEAAVQAQLRAARQRALESGGATVAVVTRGRESFRVRYLPSGEAIADPALAMDRLTGRAARGER